MAPPPLPPCAPMTSEPFHLSGTRITARLLADLPSTSNDTNPLYWRPPFMVVSASNEKRDCANALGTASSTDATKTHHLVMHALLTRRTRRTRRLRLLAA